VINYIVDDKDALLNRLKQEGVKIHDYSLDTNEILRSPDRGTLRD
jgi:hypothetical protein